MPRRRKLTELSAEVIEYFVTRASLTQSQIAELLEVDKSFVSRLRNGQRELSTYQLERLADHLGVEVGVMLIDATSPKHPVSPEVTKIMNLCEELIRACDGVSKGMKTSVGSK